jgi:rsbT antagonist protein RsbS
VVVGIQPDVALAMVRLGVSAGILTTALDLEEGMARLEVITSGAVFLPGKDGAR